MLAILGQEFPGIRLFGVDIEPRQLEFARGHLGRAGVDATLLEGDALALPVGDQSFDHVWMMWFLEHLAAADVIKSAFDALAEAPGVTREELTAALADLRSLPHVAGAGLGWVVHKATATR